MRIRQTIICHVRYQAIYRRLIIRRPNPRSRLPTFATVLPVNAVFPVNTVFQLNTVLSAKSFPMPIDVRCHECSASYRVKDALAGRQFRCKRCQADLKIPDTTSPADSEPAGPGKPRRPSSSSASRSTGSTEPRKKRRTTPRKPRRRREEPAQDSLLDPWADVADEQLQESAAGDDAEFDGIAEDDAWEDYGEDYGEDDSDYAADDGSGAYTMPLPAPKKKKKKKKPPSTHLDGDSAPEASSLPPMTFNVNRFNLAMLVVGGIIIFLGAQEMRLGLKAGSTPVEISLDNLVTKGPEDQVYFTVTDVVAGLDGYVAEEDRYGNLSQVWIPCAVNAPESDTVFVLYSDKVKTEADAEALSAAGTHTGMIINDIRGLDAETRGLLRTSGIQPENALLFEVGRRPSGALRYGSMILGGLVVMLLAIGWILFVHE